MPWFSGEKKKQPAKQGSVHHFNFVWEGWHHWKADSYLSLSTLPLLSDTKERTTAHNPICLHPYEILWYYFHKYHSRKKGWFYYFELIFDKLSVYLIFEILDHSVIVISL